MRIILLGAPGAGKGTQAEYICEAFDIPRIATGDMLRAMVKTDSALGREMAAMMAAGQLVPDAQVIQMVSERLQAPDCQQGYLFDGFPRTLAQAEALAMAKVPLDAVLEIDVPDDEIVERLSGRWTHPPSGRVYHTLFNPPRVPGTDDLTGEPLVQRPDDLPATVLKRLTVYHQQTQPLIAWYQDQEKTAENAPQFLKISGLGTVETIRDRVVSTLKQVKEKS